MKVGLRIDVDTFRGTRDGVPNLCRTLKRHGITGTFFFTVGPDNMGRHVWRLLRPAFLKKMLRSRAPGLYGWDILLRGTFWPGPQIGKHLASVIRAAAGDGHEIGLHAWDHHAWQAHIESMDARAIHAALDRGYQGLSTILGRPPTCSAAPGWRCTQEVLREKETFPFDYNSDCRGTSVFLPVVGSRPMTQPQVPTTLPTYDELIGTGDVTGETYNRHLLSRLRPEGLNVLTVHAEVEGGRCLTLFDEFLQLARHQGAVFVPLRDLVGDAAALPPGRIGWAEEPGREGRLARQEGST